MEETVLAPVVRWTFAPNTKSSTAGWLCWVATNSKESWVLVVLVIEVLMEVVMEVVVVEMLVEVPDNKVLQQ